MAALEPGKIRNVAVVGHRGTGKTSLTEALLFQSGAVNRLGTIDQGSTVADWDEDEQRRSMSLTSAVCNLEWQGRKINVIDTPGDSGFQADTIASLVAQDVTEVYARLQRVAIGGDGLAWFGQCVHHDAIAVRHRHRRAIIAGLMIHLQYTSTKRHTDQIDAASARTAVL